MGNCIRNTLWRFISLCQEGLFLNNYWVRSSSSDWLLIFTNVCKIYVARIVICDSFHDISQSIFGSSKSYCSGEFSFQIVISLVSPNCHRNAQDFLLHILFVIVCFRLGFCLFVDDQEFSDQSLWTDHVSRSARHTNWLYTLLQATGSVAHPVGLCSHDEVFNTCHEILFPLKENNWRS